MERVGFGAPELLEILAARVGCTYCPISLRKML